MAMTRAKNNLYIHSNRQILKTNCVDGLECVCDDSLYDLPEEVSLSASMTDVWLDSFKYCQKALDDLKSGDRLNVVDGRIYDSNGNEVVKFAKKFNEREIGRLQNMGVWRNLRRPSYLL